MTDQIVPGDLLERGKTITGLRLLADYLETHPDVPVARYGWDVLVYPDQDDPQASRAEVDRIAAVLGVPVTDNTDRGGHYTVERSFGLIAYRAVHIPPRNWAAYHAHDSYRGCVTPEDAGVAS